MKIKLKKLERSAYILKTIAHPVRLMIIARLNQHKELSVKQICKEVKGEQSVISHHLSNLKTKGLLSSRREGTNVFYHLKERKLVSVLDCIEKCKCNF